jgi:glycosyltransferase involved in cell wall biosynthesis
LQRPRTRVLMQGGNHKAGANRNFGISQARGRYVCCLDADDTLAPTYIEKAVYLLERHGYHVVSGALEMVGGDQGQIDVMEAPHLEALLDSNQVLTCAVFRRALWEQAGGYRDVDQAISGYVFEDWAFWVRLAALGARFRNLHHDPMLRYRVHPVSLSRGKNVPPMSRQRELVKQMNLDILQSPAGSLARSRRNRSGTARPSHLRHQLSSIGRRQLRDLRRSSLHCHSWCWGVPNGCSAAWWHTWFKLAGGW